MAYYASYGVAGKVTGTCYFNYICRISTDKGEVSILGSKIHVRAKIGYVSGFSAHADQKKELLEWIDVVEDTCCVYLVHGDIPQLEMLKQKVKNKLKEKVHIVKMGEHIHL